jgi:hypothetical protein
MHPVSMLITSLSGLVKFYTPLVDAIDQVPVFFFGDDVL